MFDSDLGVGRRTFVKGAGATIGAGALGVGSASAEDGGGDGGRGRDEGKRKEGCPERGNPMMIAHRGFAGQFPENTVGAVRAASGVGPGGVPDGQAADMIEIDVVPTADGTVVVFHDSKLSSRDGGERGLTNLDGYVWERPWSEVREAEVQRSGETVPSLEATLEAIPSHVGVNVELKNPGTSDVKFAESLSGDALESAKDRWRPFVDRVLAVTENVDHDLLFSSFYEGALAATRDLDPSIPLGTLFWDSVETGLEITRKYDAEAVHPPYNMVRGTPFFGDEYYVSGPFADADLVSVAHEEGRAVNAYTVGTWYQAERLTAAGVDGLICDYPGLLWSESGDGK